MGPLLPSSGGTVADVATTLPGAPAIPRVSVLGVGIHAVNSISASSAAFWAAHTPGVRGYITATGVHGVIASQDDPGLKAIHNRSLLSLPDGMPMVWVGRARGHATMELVGGPDFMRAIFAGSDRSCDRHYLWGGGDGVVEILKENLVRRYARAVVVGVDTPPFRPLTYDEELELVDRINRLRPNFFWVGLSTPKQERFMAGFLARHRESLRLDGQGFVMVGVGAAFDIEAGLTIEAPRWLRGSGFAWLYRLVLEPKRLWRRYLANNPRFIVGIVRQTLAPTHFTLYGYDRSSPFDR
jgi:N-acetylglucosaminyldiphosphoundecaprenol N-acetyl-beta-D-mannosaminyltransferase